MERFNDAEVTASDVDETILSAGSILLTNTFRLGAVSLEHANVVALGITESTPITAVTSTGQRFLAVLAAASIYSLPMPPIHSIDVAEYALVSAAVVLLLVFVLLCVVGKPDGEDHALLSCCASLCAFAALSGTVVVQDG